jgi:hypothetical protein
MPALTEEMLREILTEHLRPTQARVADVCDRTEHLADKVQTDQVERRLLQQTVETGFTQVSARLDGLHSLVTATKSNVNRHETAIAVQQKLCEERHKPDPPMFAAPVPAGVEPDEHLTLNRKRVLYYMAALIGGGLLIGRLSPEGATLLVAVLKHLFAGGS